MSERTVPREFYPVQSASTTDIELSEFSDRLVSQEVKVLIKKIGLQWQELGYRLSLPYHTVEKIECDQHGIENKAMAVITEWQKMFEDSNTDADAYHGLRCRGRATLDVLLKQLREMKRNDLVREIITLVRKSDKTSIERESKNKASRNPFIPPPERKTLQEIQSDLKQYYLKTEMTALPWTEVANMDLRTGYVQEEIIWKRRKARNGEDLPDKPIQQQEIFKREDWSCKKDDDPFTLLVEGLPGYGKSTLGLKLCIDWAINEKYMQKFDLVLHIALQRWDGYVEDMILKSANIEETHDKQYFWDLFCNRSKNILVVLDGLDVLPQEQMEYAGPFLTRKQYPHVSIIVLSRPREARLVEDVIESSWKVKMEDVLWEKVLFLAGLQESVQDEFLGKFTKKLDRVKGTAIEDTIHHYLQNSPNLKQLFRSPLLFQIVLTLTAESGRVLDTTTMTEPELFKGIFNHFVHRYFCSKPSDCSIPKFDLFDLEDQTREEIILMKTFGYFALNSLLSDKSTFTKEEILKLTDNDERVLELGVLVYETVNKKYEAIHQSFIYFGAAYYFWIDWQLNEVSVQPKFWDDEHSQFLESLFPILLSASCPLFSFLVCLLGEDVSKVLEVVKKHAAVFPMAFYSFAEGLLQTEMTQPLLTSLDAFIPRELVIPDNSFSRSRQFAEVIHYATTNELTKTICWNLCHCVSFPERDVKVDTLELIVHDRLGTLSYNKFTCRELHCYFLLPCLQIEQTVSPVMLSVGPLWSTILNIIESCTFETISFDFDYGAMMLWFPIFFDEITAGKLKYVNIKWMRCSILNVNQSIIPKVLKVIEVKRMGKIEIISQRNNFAGKDLNSVLLTMLFLSFGTQFLTTLTNYVYTVPTIAICFLALIWLVVFMWHTLGLISAYLRYAEIKYKVIRKGRTSQRRFCLPYFCVYLPFSHLHEHTKLSISFTLLICNLLFVGAPVYILLLTVVFNCLVGIVVFHHISLHNDDNNLRVTLFGLYNSYIGSYLTEIYFNELVLCFLFAFNFLIFAKNITKITYKLPADSYRFRECLKDVVSYSTFSECMNDVILRHTLAGFVTYLSVIIFQMYLTIVQITAVCHLLGSNLEQCMRWRRTWKFFLYLFMMLLLFCIYDARSLDSDFVNSRISEWGSSFLSFIAEIIAFGIAFYLCSACLNSLSYKGLNFSHPTLTPNDMRPFEKSAQKLNTPITLYFNLGGNEWHSWHSSSPGATVALTRPPPHKKFTGENFRDRQVLFQLTNTL